MCVGWRMRRWSAGGGVASKVCPSRALHPSVLRRNTFCLRFYLLKISDIILNMSLGSTESWNHRIVWIQKDIKDLPTPLHGPFPTSPG